MRFSEIEGEDQLEDLMKGAMSQKNLISGQNTCQGIAKGHCENVPELLVRSGTKSTEHCWL